MAAGCDDFVRKPFEEADLLERIRRQLSAEYEYAGEEPASTSASATRASTTDTPLASLPADLRRQIHDAANVANEDKLTELVAELRADHAEDAVRLESLVRDFAFDQLVRLTED